MPLPEKMSGDAKGDTKGDTKGDAKGGNKSNIARELIYYITKGLIFYKAGNYKEAQEYMQLAIDKTFPGKHLWVTYKELLEKIKARDNSFVDSFIVQKAVGIWMIGLFYYNEIKDYTKALFYLESAQELGYGKGDPEFEALIKKARIQVDAKSSATASATASATTASAASVSAAYNTVLTAATPPGGAPLSVDELVATSGGLAAVSAESLQGAKSQLPAPKKK